MFKSLFSPVKVGSLTLKNRIIYPALSLYTENSKITRRHIEFFRERAAGGAGSVNIGPTGFCDEGVSDVAFMLNRESQEDFADLARIIRQEGASPWLQIFHAGAYSKSLAVRGVPPVAPSPVYSPLSRTTPVEMSIEQIAETVSLFAETADLARRAGFDGVEISASAGYLISEFLSPLTNIREDVYGGTPENRARFALEIIKSIKEKTGPDFPLSVRMAGSDFVKGSLTSEEIPEIAKKYESAGADMLSVTGGWHQTEVPQLSQALPPGVFSYLALNIKRSVSIPVAASNRISTPENGDRIIRDGIADMVNLGRVLIADPFWPIKAASGKDDEIRRCIACSQGCTDNLFSSKPVQCILNARAGFEGERKIIRSDKKKKIMIIGAGPAGMEAALRADEAGFNVVIHEKENTAGGQLNIACLPPHKQELATITEWYAGMLAGKGIHVLFNSEVTEKTINQERPDFIILASGGRERIPEIEGADDEGVLFSWQFLREDPPLGRKVAVIGGGAVGIETAHLIAQKGTLTPEALHFLFTRQAENTEKLRELCTRGTKDVTVFEMNSRAGTGIGKSTRWAVLSDIEKLGVKIKTGCRVKSVARSAVEYIHEEKILSESFDSIIFAAGTVPLTTCEHDIIKTGIAYTKIGDCAGGTNIGDAVHGAYLAVMNLNC